MWTEWRQGDGEEGGREEKGRNQDGEHPSNDSNDKAETKEDMQ